MKNPQHAPIKMLRMPVGSEHELNDDYPLGTYYLSEVDCGQGLLQLNLWVVVPDMGLIRIPVTDGGTGEPVWGYNNNPLAPTLKPSIKCEDGVKCWHGFITDGWLVWTSGC